MATQEATIREHARLTPPPQAELFARLAALKEDIAALATTSEGHAHRTARVTDRSAHEETRQ
jgi:O-acetylhomoserine/O-acetylserine sulfhydrylase-like pyridoxal-dependent enzyme